MSSEMDACHGFLKEYFENTHFTQKDRVGNLLFMNRNKSNARKVLIGSHLDTVDNAGQYDGVLGIVIGLLLSREMAQSTCNIDVVAFCDEEGARFGNRFMGSLNFVGKLPRDYLDATDEEGTSLASLIATNSSDVETFEEYLNSNSPIFIEPHIEQGIILESENCDLGIVSSISGQSILDLRFTGKTAHAVEKWGRKNALMSACDFISQLKTLLTEEQDVHITVGKIENSPNLTNVVSDNTNVSIDVRHVSDVKRDHYIQKLIMLAQGIAQLGGVDLSHSISGTNTTHLSPKLLTNAQQICIGNGISIKELDSYAGHDSVIMSTVVQTFLLFIRDERGVSQHPEELVSVNGLNSAFKLLHVLSEEVSMEAETRGGYELAS